MASSSSGPGAAGGLSWASLVASSSSDLKFVAESRAAVIDGVLHIPKKAVDLGVQRLKSALVIQFLDSVPPLKVVRSVLNRHWGLKVRSYSPLFLIVYTLLNFRLSSSVNGCWPDLGIYTIHQCCCVAGLLGLSLLIPLQKSCRSGSHSRMFRRR
ncbi:hypothetical protein LINPERPRIM_LOCUS31474 [Linum perenne]